MSIKYVPVIDGSAATHDVAYHDDGGNQITPVARLLGTNGQPVSEDNPLPIATITSGAPTPILGLHSLWEQQLGGAPNRVTLGKDGWLYATRSGSVMKLSPTSGEVFWEYQGADGQNMVAVNAASDGRVLIGSNGRLHVLDWQGQLIEVVESPAGVSAFVIVSIVIVGQDVYLRFGNPSHMVAKVTLDDLETPVWVTGPHGGTPAGYRAMTANASGVYVAENDATRLLKKLDVNTGAVIWQHEQSISHNLRALALGEDGSLYATGRFGTGASRGWVARFNPAPSSGPTVIWNNTTVGLRKGDLAVNAVGVFTTDDETGIATKLDRATGNILWEASTGGERPTSIIAMRDKIIFDTGAVGILTSALSDLQITGYEAAQP